MAKSQDAKKQSKKNLLKPQKKRKRKKEKRKIVQKEIKKSSLDINLVSFLDFNYSTSGNIFPGFRILFGSKIDFMRSINSK